MIKTIINQDQSLPFTRKAWIGYAVFVVYVVLWHGISFVFGVPIREATFWLVTITMIAAHVYYAIQAYASTGGRWPLDLLLNFIQLSATTLLIMAHLSGTISLSVSLSLVAIVAFAHPMITDWHHIRRYFRTDVASYAPPACIPIDCTAAALALIVIIF